MAHESRLARELRALVHAQRVATLGTVDDRGACALSMVPFACVRASAADDDEAERGPWIALHVSGLAAHTRWMAERPDAVSLLVMRAEEAGEPVHALPRVSFDARARLPDRDSPLWAACRSAYLARFPEAEPMTQLGDFRFVALRIVAARHVAGFGAARDVLADELAGLGSAA